MEVIVGSLGAWLPGAMATTSVATTSTSVATSTMCMTIGSATGVTIFQSAAFIGINLEMSRKPRVTSHHFFVFSAHLCQTM